MAYPSSAVADSGASAGISAAIAACASRSERPVPDRVALGEPSAHRLKRPGERRLRALERRDRERARDARLQIGAVALGLGHRARRRRADRLRVVRVPGADRRADRVTRDPLDIVAVKQRRVVGRHPLTLELRGELAEEHRRQPRPVLPGRAAGVGDDQPLPRRLARQREDQRLLAAARRARRERRRRPLRDRLALVVEQDRVLAHRRRERPLGRPEDPHASELDPHQRVHGHDVHPARGERARSAVDHVLGAQRPDRPLDDVEEPVEVDLGLERGEPLEAAQRHHDLVGPVDVARQQALQVVEMPRPRSPARADRAAGRRARR